MNSGIFCFCQVADFNKVAVDPKQIQHEYGDHDGSISETALLRAMKGNDFKAKVISKLKLDNINPRVLPAILQDNEGEYFILVAIKNENFIIIKPGATAVESFSAQDLNESYSGRAILITYKHSETEADAKFNIKWFVPALWKYKHIFKDVLIASLFLQLFGLVTPFFFQVVMDKVIMRNGLTTLNTLVIVFFVVSVFEVFFGTIRTYLFSHTTSRVDVVLGSKLFSHLMKLPLSYFESRQVGQNVIESEVGNYDLGDLSDDGSIGTIGVNSYFEEEFTKDDIIIRSSDEFQIQLSNLSAQMTDVIADANSDSDYADGGGLSDLNATTTKVDDSNLSELWAVKKY